MPVGKTPTSCLMLAAWLAAASPVGEELAAALDAEELFLCARLPRTPPRTAARMTATATGIPIQSHFLVVRLGCDVVRPEVSLAKSAMTSKRD